MEEERDIEERGEEREEIYSYLKCKICDGYFENAKILTECFHSFCLVCISQSAECLTQENHFSIACEICNTITTTPSLSLLPNYSIAEKLLKNFNPNNIQPKILSHSVEYCDNEICKENNKKASLYCDKCEANYCEECWKVVHSFGGIQKHSPLLIHQKINTKYCSTHLNRPLKLYCVPCDQLLCSLCVIDEHQNPLNNNNNNIIDDNNNNNNNNSNINVKEEHKVISVEKASETAKEELISKSDLIISNRRIIDDRLNENKAKIGKIDIRISNLKAKIEKLENEKEIISNKIKEDEENSTQIEISNRMIKDMIQSLPCVLTTQKKYRDQIDNQISRVFESIYSFPLDSIVIHENDLIKYENDDDLCILNAQSYKGDVNSFTLSNDGKKFTKKQVSYCGITVKKGISSGKYQWKISYDNPINKQGYLLIGVQLNKPICSSPSSLNEKETFGININNKKFGSSGNYRIEGKQVAPKEANILIKDGEELEVIVDCDKGIFQLISPTFNHSISIPILQQNENYFLHFLPYSASFSILSSGKFE